MACKTGCGRPRYRQYDTCCTHCKGPDGPHASDCNKKAMESRSTSQIVDSSAYRKEMVPYVHRDRHPIETFEAVWAKAQTGDVLLVSGAPDLDSPMAKSIKLATRSAFSHIGLIVREPSERMWKTYGRLRGKAAIECGTGAWGEGEEVPKDRVTYVFDSDYEEDGTVDGPVLRPMEEVIRAYLQDDYHGTEADIVVRRLQIPDARRPDIQAGFDRFADEVAGRCFEAKSMTDGAFTQMLMSVWGGNKSEDLTRLFCSELAAATYEEAGLLPKTENATNYQPTHFAEGSKQMDNLLGGATLGPEVVMDLNELLYDLSITVEAAEGLNNPYFNPLKSVDPYCNVSFAGRLRFSTSHVNKSLNPSWTHEQTCKYDGVSSISFEVYDHRTFGKDYQLAVGSLSCDDFIESDGFDGHVTLRHTDGGADAKLKVKIKIARKCHSCYCKGGSDLGTSDKSKHRHEGRARAATWHRRKAELYYWKDLKHGNPIPADAVEAGVTAEDNVVWVGRQDGYAGKVNADDSGGNMNKFYAHGLGQSQSCQILCFEGDHSWVSINHGQRIPPNAVKAGETKSDGVVYVGRFKGEAGKINCDDGNMHNFWGHHSGRQDKGVAILIIEAKEGDSSKGKGKGGYEPQSVEAFLSP